MVTTNKANALETIVQQGLRSLRKCLWDNSLCYWPQEGEENGLPERNLSVHVARSFLEDGWLVFAEASFPGRTDRRIDLLALKEGILVATECKQLDSPDRAAELARDLEELRDFRLTTAWDTDKWQAPTISTRFGLLLVNTWSPAIKKWWLGSNHSSLPEGRTGNGWKDLGNAMDSLARANLPTFGEECLNCSNGQQDFWAMYAIFRLPTSPLNDNRDHPSGSMKACSNKRGA